MIRDCGSVKTDPQCNQKNQAVIGASRHMSTCGCDHERCNNGELLKSSFWCLILGKKMLNYQMLCVCAFFIIQTQCNITYLQAANKNIKKEMRTSTCLRLFFE